MSAKQGFIQQSDAFSIIEFFQALRRGIFSSVIIFGTGLVFTLFILVPRQSETFTSVATVQVSAFTFNMLRKSEIVNAPDMNVWFTVGAQDPKVLRELKVSPSTGKLPDGYHFAMEGEFARFAVSDRSASVAVQQAKDWARLTAESLRESVTLSRQRVASFLADLSKKEYQKSESSSSTNDRDTATREMDELKKSIRTVRDTLDVATALTQDPDWLVLKDLKNDPPVYPEVRSRNLLIPGIAASLFFAIALPVAFNLLKNVVSSLNVPTAFPTILIPRFSSSQDDALQSLHSLFVTLQLKQRELCGNKPIVVAITSADRAAGKTTLCAKLAELAKGFGEQVVAIDADPGEKSLTKVSGCRASASIFSLPLTADIKALPTSTKGGYAVLPANDVGMLDTLSVRRALERLRATYNFILVDVPPLPCSGNASSVIQAADLALIVARNRRTPVPAIEKTFELVKLAGGQNVIYVLNGIDKLDLQACGAN